MEIRLRHRTPNFIKVGFKVLTGAIMKGSLF
jgi:hypothetical protein